jgi:hypothetical protein
MKQTIVNNLNNTIQDLEALSPLIDKYVQEENINIIKQTILAIKPNETCISELLKTL